MLERLQPAVSTLLKPSESQVFNVASSANAASWFALSYDIVGSSTWP